MMRAARQAAERVASKLDIPVPTLLGVTILTSIDEAIFQRDFGTHRRLQDQVAHLAELSQNAGLDGVVASPLEIERVREVCGGDFVVVTPRHSPVMGGVRRSAADYDAGRGDCSRGGLYRGWAPNHGFGSPP